MVAPGKKIKVERDVEERWCQLPTLLLWMIKDRLNFLDSFNFGRVCKNWKSAALCYPSKPQPWLICRKSTETEWDFVNVATKEKLILRLPELHDGVIVLFSRRGWILLLDIGINVTDHPFFVLLNIHTNAKVVITAPQDYFSGAVMKACFCWLEDDSPNCVALVIGPSSGKPYGALYIASVEDKIWVKHSSHEDDDGRGMDHPLGLVINRNKVYVLDYNEDLFIFDMDRLSWKKVDVNGEQNYSNSSISKCYLTIVEFKGWILKLNCHADVEPFWVLRLNDSETGWQALNETEDKCWFLNSGSSFIVRDNTGSNKIYRLRGSLYVTFNVNKRVLHVEIMDLNSGRKDSYELDHEYARWVDLGWMESAPSSCVSLCKVDL